MNRTCHSWGWFPKLPAFLTPSPHNTTLFCASHHRNLSTILLSGCFYYANYPWRSPMFTSYECSEKIPRKESQETHWSMIILFTYVFVFRLISFPMSICIWAKRICAALCIAKNGCDRPNVGKPSLEPSRAAMPHRRATPQHHQQHDPIKFINNTIKYFINNINKINNIINIINITTLTWAKPCCNATPPCNDTTSSTSSASTPKTSSSPRSSSTTLGQSRPTAGKA